MKWSISIKNWFKNNQSSTENSVESCPNCWGRQEYDGQIYESEIIENNGFDAAKIGWISAYIKNKINFPTRKENGIEKICNRCKIAYTSKI